MGKSTLLQNATLLTESGEVLRSQNVLVEEGRIRRIRDYAGDRSVSGELQTDAITADEVIDCTDYIVSPSLVNLHAHTAMNIFKGISEDVTADAWFNEMIWPYESKMTEEDVYVGTLLGIAEMLNNGITAVADHYFGEEKVLRAARETGIRMDLAPTIFGTAPNFSDRLTQVRDFIGEHRGDSDRIAFHMGAHSNYTCPSPTLEQIVEAAKEMEIPMHLHLSEEEPQVKRSRELTGKTPMRVYYEAGGFDVPTIIAHGLWVEEEDLPLLGEDTWFAFCPKTYMKLASGRGGFFRFCDRLSYSFGTDGAASSNTLSTIEQARLFGLLEKYQQMDAAIHPAKEIWKHLMDGHRALPFGTGRLQEGAPADLVIWDLNTPDTFAWYHPLSSILYSSNSQNIRYTMVGGEFLKYDGRLRMDVKAVLRDGMALQKSLLERGKGKAEVFY